MENPIFLWNKAGFSGPGGTLPCTQNWLCAAPLGSIYGALSGRLRRKISGKERGLTSRVSGW